MRYIDDLEISFLPASNMLLIRSESRVGESDLGVNQKRVDLLKSKISKIAWFLKKLTKLLFFVLLFYIKYFSLALKSIN